MTRSLLVALALAVVATLSGCDAGGADEDQPHRVAAGEMIPAAGVPTELGDGHVVMLPSGKVTFTVTDPIRHVDFTDTTRTDDLEPADGVDLVGISWEHERYVYARDVGEALAGNFQVDKTKDVRLTLVADDKSYEFTDVGNLAEAGGSDYFHIGLPRAAKRLSLEVEYDGLVQVLDLRTGKVDKGAAAPLYGAGLAPGSESDLDEEVRCPVIEQRRDRLEWFNSCSVLRALAVPYVPEQGWAGAGRSFVVAWTGAGVESVYWILDDNHYASYTTKARRLRTTLDGTAPVSTIPGEVMNYGDEWQVFDVPSARAHRIRFTGQFVGKPEPGADTGGRHPKAPVFDLDESLRLSDPTF